MADCGKTKWLFVLMLVIVIECSALALHQPCCYDFVAAVPFHAGAFSSGSRNSFIRASNLASSFFRIS